jgi:protein SCO1/2
MELSSCGFSRKDIAHGSAFQLDEQRGNLVLLFFGYTSCPDVCPTSMAELKTAIDKVGPKQADQVRVVFVRDLKLLLQ